MKRFVALSIIVLFLANSFGCATMTRSVHAYPVRGQNYDQQMRDQNECSYWAQQQSGNSSGGVIAGGAEGAIGGAAVGAAAGAIGGAISGSPGTGAAMGAGIGGLLGALAGIFSGSTQAQDSYNRAYAVCMSGRGYSVQ